RVLVILESFWAVGWILAAIIGYFIIPDFGWQVAVLLGAIPAFYAGFARRGIPESPLYKKQESIPLKSLFTSYKRETVMIWLVWFCVAFSYYGMFLWLPSVMVAKGFGMIKSFQYVLIMTFAQLPGYALSAWLIEKWGRKATLGTLLLGTAVAAWFFGQSETLTSLIVFGSMLSFFNLGAWGALYAYTPELYPTTIRGSGAGFAAGFGRVGSIFAPIMVGMLLSNGYTFAFIFGLFAIIIVIGSLSVFILGKETKGKVLAE
ncbi:MAG: MFS transporter, partial [Bacilli bacterium]